MSLIVLVFFLALILLFLFGLFFIVEQQTVAIIQTLGKFSRMANAGLNFKIPLIQTIAGKVSLRIRQLDVIVETKTYDNVFVGITVSVQYFVLPDKIYEAFYRLNDPYTQIKSYVFDVVRARVPRIKLDDLFEKKDEIAIAVKGELSQIMEEFGYDILKALVTDIAPDENVKKAMNEINAAQRIRMAAEEKGEAEKILVVKKAQAAAESKALEGKGIADQRRAIVMGLKDSVHDFQSGVVGTTPQDVMNLVLLTQYFDTLKEVGQSSVSNTILVPHSPGVMQDLVEQIRNSMIVANEISGKGGKKREQSGEK